MKSKFVIQRLGIALGVICLAGCVSPKTSLKNQVEKKSSGISDGAHPSESTVIPPDKITIETKKTVDKKTAEVPEWVAGNSEANQSLNDKALSDLANKLRTSRIDSLSDSTTICTVNGEPITVGDYRRQFKTEQEQMQASLAMNPQLSNNLIRMAHEQGVMLNAEERKRLINSANKMQVGGTKSFNQMLAQNHMTKNQFRDQVFDVGLAFKMSGKLIEEGLLKELISRKLLSQAAKAEGHSKEALNKYNEVSKSPQYKRLLEVSGISVSNLRDDIITNELCLKQIEKIKNESPVTDSENSALINNALGILFKRKGDFLAAQNAYREAINSGGNNFPVIHYNLALLLEKMNKSKEAAYEFNTYLRLAPNGINARNAQNHLKKCLNKASWQQITLFLFRLKHFYPPD